MEVRFLSLTLMIKKIIIGLLILGATYFAYQKWRPKSIEEKYELAPVTREDIRQTVTASGKIKSATQVDLKFQTSGWLAWVGVKEGDRVNKWQAIAGLDRRELQKDLQKYLLDFSKERADFDEDLKITYRDKALTDTIGRILQKNQFDLDKAVLDVEIADIALKLATLVSPINGIVTRAEPPVSGSNITPTTAVYTVADPDHLVFEAEIDETDIGKLSAGQTAQLTLDAFPNQTLPLTVDSINFQSSTDAAGSTIYLVKFNLTNDPDYPFRLGMNGEVIITTNQKEAVLTLPIEAVNNRQVQLVEAKKIIKKEVATGIESDTEIEIISGLETGQIVVTGNRSK